MKAYKPSAADGYIRYYDEVKNTNILAHKDVYEEIHGELPKGIIIHHLCGNKYCCNPKHLIAMSRADHIKLHWFYDDNFNCRKAKV